MDNVTRVIKSGVINEIEIGKRRCDGDLIRSVVAAATTRKPVNRWGSAKRYVTQPKVTVVYNRYVLSFVPETFVHADASTHICDVHATTIRGASTTAVQFDLHFRGQKARIFNGLDNTK